MKPFNFFFLCASIIFSIMSISLWYACSSQNEYESPAPPSHGNVVNKLDWEGSKIVVIDSAGIARAIDVTPNQFDMLHIGDLVEYFDGVFSRPTHISVRTGHGEVQFMVVFAADTIYR